MNHSDCKYLSEKLSNQQIYDMLQAAKAGVKDWTKSSKANAMFSRGAFWNTFKCGEFNVNKTYHDIVKYRLIQEFGEFLPGHLKPVRKKHKPDKIWHQDPIFTPDAQ